MTFLERLLNLPESAVFAIENSVDKRVYIGYSSCLSQKLIELIGVIRRGERYGKQMKEDIRNLKLVVLEEVDCRNRGRMRHTYYNDLYKQNGWNMYVENPTVRYKPKQYVYNLEKNNAIMSVQLVSAGNKKILVGLFDSKIEADEFIKIHYPNEFCYDIIYATNEISMRYIKKKVADEEN